MSHNHLSRLVSSAHSSQSFRTCGASGRVRLARCVCTAVLLITCLYSSAAAQTSQKITDGSTPSALAAGAPVGSYTLSGFETVNPYNGGLNFSLPLLRVGGRGEAGYDITLRIDHKWVIRK